MRPSRIALAALISIAGPLVLMGASFINSNVAVCDPATPANCAKPASDGSFAVTTTTAPASGAFTVTAATVGVSSAQVLAAGTRKYLFIQNVSASAYVACRSDGGTAAINTAGSFMLPPLASKTWESSATPNAAITCIASVASTPVTIESL